MGCSIAETRACCKEGSIGAKIGIGAGAGIGTGVGINAGAGISAGVSINTGVGIGASLSKDTFGPFWIPLPASSVVYSRGVSE